MKARFEQQTPELQLPSQNGCATALLERPQAPASTPVAGSAPRRVPVRLAAPHRASGVPAPTTHTVRVDTDRGLVEVLLQSRLYQDYERAFTDATGLPLTLRPVEAWQIPLHGKRHEAPYCALMAATSRACANCLQMQEKLAQGAKTASHTMECGSGLTETAVPVKLGERLIGYLQTGQVFSRKPTTKQFERAAELMADSGLERQQLKEAFFATRVMAPKQQASATKLLSIFAEHLSMLSNQVVVHQENAEPPAITKAKAFIEEHLAEEVRLAQVAKHVGMSSYYFCKIFRKGTGVNFTDYLSRVRIERARNLLLNPNLRISEIAYDVGFQSLTHFNRVFRRVLGQSPTEYRAQLLGKG